MSTPSLAFPQSLAEKVSDLRNGADVEEGSFYLRLVGLV